MTKPPTLKRNIAILHYSASPVIGGVEAVMHAHAHLFMENGYNTSVVSGVGETSALPAGTNYIQVPLMDSQHPQILAANQALEQGLVPHNFETLVDQLTVELMPLLEPFDHIIAHNLFSKHFNLPLTTALFRILEKHRESHWIAWCHDLTWTSPNSAHKVHAGYPWDLLRTYHPEITYVVVSEQRQRELADLLGRSADEIRVIYNGVDPELLLGLSPAGRDLVSRLGLLTSDLFLLMPVRVTQAKNIEYALHVTAALKEKGCSPKLVVTGPPDPHDEQSMSYFRSLQALRTQLDVEDEMHFVFESAPDKEEPFTIGLEVVADLLRLADIMFMPSHREGFGMPVLEAALTGVQVVTAEVPAAQEIGMDDVIRFNLTDEPGQVADKILEWTRHSAIYRLRARVRKYFTWRAIFQQNILPLLSERERR